jgi:uncharacterized DUF497 family protein
MHMDIEWDPAKGAANLEKHGVTFEEASRREDRIRLISARKATRREAKFYA